MDEMQVIGYAVTTIITLGAFVVVIQRFTQPIGELRLAIQKLIDTIDTLKSDNATQNKRIERHGKEIDNLTAVNIIHRDGLPLPDINSFSESEKIT